MRHMRAVFAQLTLTSALLVSTSVYVHAQEAAAVADRFKALMAAQGIEISWTSIDGSGSSFALQGVKVGPAGAKLPAEVGKVTFDGVTDEDGAYAIQKVSTDPFSKTQDGATVELSPIVFTGVKLPAEGATDALANILFYEGAKVDNFVVKLGDKTAFSLTGLSAEIAPPAGGEPMTFSGEADRFSADLSLVEDPQAKAAIQALGYENLSGSLAVNGSWQPTDGRMAFEQYDITVDNAGTFGMSFDLGGYTPAFIKSLQELQKKMAAQPEGADNSAEGMAMLGLMQQLTFHSASMRWDDDSLTNKVIDYVAKMQNMKPDDIRNQAKAIVPFMAAQLNNPDLSAKLTEAVVKYLDAPQSLEISAQPANPVPFAQIAAAGMSNPIELTKTLGVTVTANEDGEEE